MSNRNSITKIAKYNCYFLVFIVKCKIGNKYFDEWNTDSEGIARTETKITSGIFKLEEIKAPNRIYAIR